jgi:hypothetical protein
MDVNDILRCMDDGDDVLASLKATLSLILKTKEEKTTKNQRPQSAIQGLHRSP